jgi:predicted AAA+ superfamily ATPase
MLDGIKKPEKLIKLLQALAFQVGSQVSYNEIGTLVGLDSKTIEKYVDLLEQSFVIFKLNSFSRNLRNELKFSRKIYFYDNGIRNAVINNFSPLAIRQDTGMLWENYLVSERMKRNHYDKNYCNSFFWRTKAQQEVDYLEEKNGKLFAYEFKWNSKKNAKITKTFTSNYPEAEINIITPENYLDFVL